MSDTVEILISRFVSPSQRIADGAVISCEDIARQIELKRRLIFNLPRLIRNVEGRPLGVSIKAWVNDV